MSKKLKDYKPKDILLSYEAVQNILQSFQQREKNQNSSAKYRDLTITLFVSLVGCIISIVTAFSTMSNIARAGVILIAAGLVVYAAICAFKWCEANSELKHNSKDHTSFENMVFDKVQESIRYTAIARIVYRAKDEMRYLVGADYFLPHCTMAFDTTIYEQESNITQSLYDDFGIQGKDIWKIKLVDEQIYFSIKPIHGRIQMNGYAFYDVEVKVQAKKKLLEQDERRNWMSLDSMRKNPIAVSTNKDVIDLLAEFPKPTESFVNPLGNFNIIWNITSKCDYNCAICATRDETRPELSTKEKIDVLNSICTAKHYIKELDFAGGDPLLSDETTSVIQTAISQLGADKISVTTTGNGLEKLSTRKFSFSDLIKHSEITIDAAHGNLGSNPGDSQCVSRQEENYCEANINQINVLLDHAESLTINIPIINDDLNDNEINDLVSKIAWIKAHNANAEIDALLIRLMPVGQLATTMSKEKYQNYNPLDVTKKILERLKNVGVSCRLHCSFRVLPCFNDEFCTNHCSMLENKIGIDCAGNVFACAWAGYLPINTPPTKNPFYLGNLTKVKLIDILEGASKTQPYQKIFSEISSKQHRHFCSVISYYANREMFHDFDYLSQKCKEQADDH